MPYLSMLFAADLNSLASRREDISRKFFHSITQSTSCLHHLLPDPKLSHNSRLRSYEKFPILHTRTKRYRSFVQYALSHYQDSLWSFGVVRSDASTSFRLQQFALETCQFRQFQQYATSASTSTVTSRCLHTSPQQSKHALLCSDRYAAFDILCHATR